MLLNEKEAKRLADNAYRRLTSNEPKEVDIIRQQMESISNLVNNALKNLSEEQFGLSYEKPVEERGR